MNTEALFQEIETLSPAQLERVYSFVCQLKHSKNLFASFNEQESVEPFINEKEAVDFANYYAARMLNAAR